MKSDEEILNELNGLSPHIAGILKVNVFSVPVGYFEKLTVQILNTAKQEEQAFINSGTITMPLQVPQGYFDTLNILIIRANVFGISTSRKFETFGKFPGFNPLI